MTLACLHNGVLRRSEEMHTGKEPELRVGHNMRHTYIRISLSRMGDTDKNQTLSAFTPRTNIESVTYVGSYFNLTGKSTLETERWVARNQALTVFVNNIPA